MRPLGFWSNILLSTFAYGLFITSSWAENTLFKSLNETDYIHFSHEQGFYSAPFLLLLTNEKEEAVIRYTLNGGEPGPHSELYSEPIPIYEKNSIPGPLSSIPTNPENANPEWIWKPPLEPAPKHFVIRARSFIGEIPVSAIFTRSYFMTITTPEFCHLAVVSLVLDSCSFFDYHSGIYVPGFHHDQNPEGNHPWGTGNYHMRGKEWERPANMTMIDPDGRVALQIDVGIRIHGGGSRSLPQKSLRIYARPETGEESFDYPFFREKEVTGYKRIILRNAGQDFWKGLINDAITHVLLHDLDLETQSYQPVLVFINGEFWGLHNIRDRIDRYYLEYTKEVSPNAVDLLTGQANTLDVIEGDNEHYQFMLQFIRDFDISHPFYYEQLGQMMEIDNYIDYTIAKQYFAVYDWPGNNVDFWRPRSQDGRWRWIFYDNDGALLDPEHDFMTHSTLEGGTDWPNPDWSTFLFRNLLKNSQFRKSYVDRFAWHLEHTFEAKRVNAVIDSLAKNIESIVPLQIQRWNYPLSFEFWQWHINAMKHFATERPCLARAQLIDYFSLDEEIFLPQLCTHTSTGNQTAFPASETVEEEAFTLFPNPTSKGKFHIQFQGAGVFNTMVMVFDLQGRLLHRQQKIFESSASFYTIQPKNLQPGVYVVVIQNDHSRQWRKLLLVS